MPPARMAQRSKIEDEHEHDLGGDHEHLFIRIDPGWNAKRCRHGLGTDHAQMGG
jgi:hypothetical protein